MNQKAVGKKRMGAMHDEDEELALNVKAIGLAIGGAIVAGLLFVLARRDDKKPVEAHGESATAAVTDDIKRTGKEARKKQKALKKSAEKHAKEAAQHAQGFVAHAGVEARNAERDVKAAAWDALQEARTGEGMLRTAGSRVAEDAAHLASKLTHEARNLAEEGKGRVGQLRHRDDVDLSIQDEIARLREELAHLRDQSSGGRGARRELSALASKITRTSGLDPNSVAADALAAGLDHLERSLKAKAPELLASRDRRQVAAILQSELGPVLRDSFIKGATAALSSWEAAKSAASDLPMPHAQSLRTVVAEAPSQVAQIIHRSEPEASSDAATSDEMVRLVEKPTAIENDVARKFEEEVKAVRSSDSDGAPVAPAEDGSHPANDHHGKAGWLWAAAGLGLSIYALADADRREQILKLANEGTVLAQELLRDLQGYDDEFA